MMINSGKRSSLCFRIFREWEQADVKYLRISNNRNVIIAVSEQR